MVRSAQHPGFSVSVVVPTVGRDDVQEAVRSALAQTYPVLEVLVVADTLDDIAVAADPRVRIIRVGPGAGGNVARQTGIEQASGDLIALLDDDDEWVGSKLERQLAAIADADLGADSHWLCTSRVIKRTPLGEDTLLPQHPLGKDTPVLEYVFLRQGVRSSHGFIQASTLLFPRRMALEVPFDTSLRFHQDISWLIDISTRLPDLAVLQVWEGLTVYNTTAGSVSKRISPDQSIDWAVGRLGANPRLLGDFILTQSLGFAKNTGSAGAMARTIRRAMRVGRPGAAALLYAALTFTKAVLTGRARFGGAGT